jgi:hypothetical protein
MYIYIHIQAASSADHTINSLRYADRVKEKTVVNIPSHIGANPPSAPLAVKQPAAGEVYIVMYVFVYVYMHVSISIYIYINIYIYIYIYTIRSNTYT